MKYLTCIYAYVLAFVGCANAELSEPVCKTSELSINASVPSALVPINEVGTIIDLSEVLEKVSDYGYVTINVDSNILSGNLSWARHLVVTIKSVKKSDKYPEMILVDQDINPNMDENSLRTLASSPQLKEYFIQGELELTFKFDKGPGTLSSFKHNICTTLTVSAEKSFL